MAFIIAAIILVVLSVFLMGLRAYLSFSALIVGFFAFLSGLLDGEEIYLYIGIACLAYAFIAAYMSVRGFEQSQRKTQMFRFFVYGFLLFARFIMVALIITIPLVHMFNAVLAEYKEMVVVDNLGRQIGTVHVDKNLKTPDGKQYRRPDDPY